MILEAGIVVSKAAHSVMVETIQKTTCDSCVAQPGCGHSVLSKLTSSSVQIRVLLGDFNANEIRLGQSVTIGIPYDVVVKGSLLVYLVPLTGALLGAWLMGSPAKSPELDLFSIMGAFVGLMCGGFFVYLRSQKNVNHAENNPILCDIDKIPRIFETFS
jgi:sigma-E factor negative regulatory protein RseC|tara:strand:+ start:302 stop:778 length:477 start_codon:yes stop_codon:yes gene_type:complete